MTSPTPDDPTVTLPTTEPSLLVPRVRQSAQQGQKAAATLLFIRAVGRAVGLAVMVGRVQPLTI